jgi:predicted DNA-binding transcriptional regulator AlpA
MAPRAKRDAKCVSAEEAFRHLGIDRTTGYRAIKDGTFPLPVIHVGRLLKVPTAALHRLLDPDNAYDVDTDAHGPAA